MQSPVLVFDHISKQSAVILPGPQSAQQLADLETEQRKQVTSSGGRPPR
jgi:hypothetical protein